MAITVEINGKTYTFRNLEEQVLFLTKELTKVQQSLGNALPDPIPGPPGEPGATGGPGPEGPRGTGIFGCTAALPSPTAYKEGDLYVLFSGDLYRKINGAWVLQTNLKGPQGPVGLTGGTDVIANPVSSPTDHLEKISIDGTVYDLEDNDNEISQDKVLSKTGKILTNFADLGETEEGYINSLGEVVQSDYRKVTGFIRTRAGLTIKADGMYLYLGDSTVVYGVACYDENKNFMLGYGIYGNTSEAVSGEFAVPEGCCYLRISDENYSNAVFSIPEVEYTNILVDTINKNVEPFRLNKKIAVFGDSIFAIAGGTGNGIADFMRKYSEAEIDNFALGGTGICDIHNGWSPSFEPFDFPALINAITSGDFTNQDAHVEDEEVPDYFASVIEKLKTVNLSDYDIVILSYGANDYTGEMNEATIKSAIENAVTKLYTLNENINIVFDLPHYRLWDTPDDYIDDAYTHKNGLNYTLGDVINFFKEKLDTYGIAYIDNLKECNWNQYNMNKYFYHADGAHFLASGCKECAKRIVAKLSSIGFDIEKEE